MSLILKCLKFISLCYSNFINPHLSKLKHCHARYFFFYFSLLEWISSKAITTNASPIIGSYGLDVFRNAFKNLIFIYITEQRNILAKQLHQSTSLPRNCALENEKDISHPNGFFLPGMNWVQYPDFHGIDLMKFFGQPAPMENSQHDQLGMPLESVRQKFSGPRWFGTVSSSLGIP